MCWFTLWENCVQPPLVELSQQGLSTCGLDFNTCWSDISYSALQDVKFHMYMHFNSIIIIIIMNVQAVSRLQTPTESKNLE